ncbi:MAG: PilW family protein [Xanthomonadales bacterium]|nr:PilW family protein [Xanthomonadales bacterium]
MRNQLSNRGFSLVEMMIAIAVGAIMMIALVVIASDTLATARVQDGSARLQENGRYALSRIRRDIHQMLYFPISSVQKRLPRADDSPSAIAPGGGVFLNATPKTIVSFLNPATPQLGFGPAGLTTLHGGGQAEYHIPPNYLLAAHECGASTCDPALTIPQAAYPNVPASGTAAGARMPNTDVLTSRFLTSFGVRVSQDSLAGYPVPGAPNAGIRLENGMDPALPPLNLVNGDPVLVASSTAVAAFSATIVPGGIAALAGGGNLNPIGGLSFESTAATRELEARVYNLRDGFEVVSYYVRLKADPNRPGRLIGTLVRQVGSQVEELIEGVERFDLRFGVEGNAGVRYMNAAELYSRMGGTIGCPAAPDRDPASAYNDATMGCLWRNVGSIEVSLLLNTIDDLPVSGNEPYRYSAASTAPTATPLLDPGVSPPSPLPAGSMLRREFRETIQMKNGNGS